MRRLGTLILYITTTENIFRRGFERGHLVQDSKQSIYYECVLSKFEVDEVYGGEIKAGNSIYIFEPVDCRENQMDCTDGYSLMKRQEEYVLFLTKLKNAGYGDGEYVYAPISTTYEKYSCKDSFPNRLSEEVLEEPEKMHAYSEYNQEVYLYDKEMYDKYCRLKKQVLELIKCE